MTNIGLKEYSFVSTIF